MRDPLARVPVKYKLSLTFLIISLVAFGIGGVVVTSTARTALEDQIKLRLDARSEATSIVVERHLDLLGRRAEDFASDGFIRTETEAMQAESTAEDLETVSAGLRRHLLQNKLPLVDAFVDAGILGAAGEPLLHARAGWTPQPEEARADTTWFGPIRAATDEHPYPTFVLATPLRSLEGNRRIGVLEMLVRADTWAAGMRELSRLPTHGVVLVELIDPNGIRLPLQRVREEPAAATLIRMSMTIDRNGWELQLSMDREASMEPIAGLQRHYLITGALLLLATLLVIWFPVRFVLRPLGAISEAARRIGGGDFSTRVSIESRDEIGDLSRAFNIMARAVEERARKLVDAAESLRRREADIRFERDRLEVVFKSMQDGMFILDREGRITLSNAAAQPLVRALEARESAAQPLDCGANRPSAHPCLHCLMDLSRVHEPCVIRHEGRVYEVHMTSLPSPGEPVAGRLCVSRDVSARISEAEQQSHQERMAVLGEIAAVMAHELNNPLAAIAMFGQMLESQLEPGSSQRESAEVIRRNTETCKRTIRGLLDLAAQGATETTRFDAHEMVEDVLRLLRPVGERAGVTLDLETGVEDATLSGDELQLRQVMINLVLNAVQASEEGGGAVLVSTAERSERLEFDVRDSGRGIAPEAQPHIFEPFFTTKAPGVGTGLGLPTSRRVVEAHGGTLDLVEAGAEGSLFRLSFPRQGSGAAWRASTRVTRAVGRGAPKDD